MNELEQDIKINNEVKTDLKETKVDCILQDPTSSKFEKLNYSPNIQKIKGEKIIKRYKIKIFISNVLSKLLFKCLNIIFKDNKFSPEPAFD